MRRMYCQIVHAEVHSNLQELLDRTVTVKRSAAFLLPACSDSGLWAAGVPSEGQAGDASGRVFPTFQETL